MIKKSDAYILDYRLILTQMCENWPIMKFYVAVCFISHSSSALAECIIAWWKQTVVKEVDIYDMGMNMDTMKVL